MEAKGVRIYPSLHFDSDATIETRLLHANGLVVAGVIELGGPGGAGLMVNVGDEDALQQLGLAALRLYGEMREAASAQAAPLADAAVLEASKGA